VRTTCIPRYPGLLTQCMCKSFTRGCQKVGEAGGQTPGERIIHLLCDVINGPVFRWQAKIEKRSRREQLYEGSRLLDQHKKQVRPPVDLSNFHQFIVFPQQTYEEMFMKVCLSVSDNCHHKHSARSTPWKPAVLPSTKAKISTFHPSTSTLVRIAFCAFFPVIEVLYLG
jgi:hypothetical protein